MRANAARLVVVFCSSVLAILAGLFLKGPYTGSDTPQFLSAGADFIGALSGELAMESITGHRLFPSYFISSIYLGGIHDSLSLGHYGVIACNAILFALTTCIVFTLWRLLAPMDERSAFGIPAVGMVAGGIYIVFGLPDAFLWSYAVLTDIVFLFWVTVFVLAVLKGTLEGSRSMWILAVVMGLAAPFVRPPGILLPLLLLLAACIYWLPVVRRRPLTAMAACVAVPVFLTATVAPWLILASVSNGGLADSATPSFFERFFRQSAVFFLAGTVVSNRIELGAQEVLSYGHIIKTITYRLLYYWVPIRTGGHSYSLVHNLANGVYMVATLPLLCIGVLRLLRGAGKEIVVLLFLVVVALGFALLHAVTLVSFDWRYQLPGMVPYWILVGLGWCRWLADRR